MQGTMTKATGTRDSMAVGNGTPGSGQAQSINGIDVAALRGCIQDVTEMPARGMTGWTIRSQWMGGTRADHHVSGCTIGSERVDRSFTISTDEPRELCGTNMHANPQEHLLAGLNACMMVGYAAVAALMGINLTKLEVETSGQIDLRAFLGIDGSVPAGYPGLRQVVRIAGDGTAEQFAALHETVRKTSPNFYNLTRAVPTDSQMVVERAG